MGVVRDDHHPGPHPGPQLCLLQPLHTHAHIRACTHMSTGAHIYTCTCTRVFMCAHTDPKATLRSPSLCPGKPSGRTPGRTVRSPSLRGLGGPPSSRALSQCMVVFGGLCGDRWGPGFVQLVPGVVDVAPPPRAGAQGEGARQRGLRRREGRAACAEAPLAAGTEASSRSPR